VSLDHLAGALERWSIRDETTVPVGSLTFDSVQDFFSIGERVAGVQVTPAAAMQVSAVFACVRLIAGAIAALPLPIFERLEDSRRPTKHELWWLLNEQPNEYMTAAAMWEYLVASQLLYGDGFAVLRRNANNRITGIIPVDPRAVSIRTIRTGRWDYRQIYGVADSKETLGVEARDMLHLPGLGFNGERSMSVIQHAARTAIGVAIAADQQSASTFTSGLQPRMTLEAPAGKNLTEEQVDQLRRQFVERYGPIDANGRTQSALPLVLAGGIQAKPLSISPVDAQLIEARKFQVIDIARAFGVPPFMIGENEKTSSWGSGIEQQSLGFVKYTLQPHLRRIEQELNRKIWPVRERFFTEFNVNGLLRGDAKSRAEYYRQALGGNNGPGWMTVNEVRDLENLEEVDGADELFTTQAQTNANPDVPSADGTDPQQSDGEAGVQPADVGS